MKTRRQNYSPGKLAKDKKLKTSPKAVKKLSNKLVTKANVKTPKRNVKITQKESDNSTPSKTKAKKPQTAVKVKENRNSNLEETKGKKSKINKVTEVKRKIPVRKAKASKGDVEIIGKKSTTLRKGRGKLPKTSVNQKKVTKTPNSQNTHVTEVTSATLQKRRGRPPKIIEKQKSPLKLEKSKESEDMKVIHISHDSPCCQTPEPEDITERNHEENVDVAEDDDVEIEENNNVELLEESHINIQNGNDLESQNENEVEMQVEGQDRDQKTVASDDDSDDYPDEVTFGSSKEEVMDKLKIIKHGIDKIRDERKEMRKKIQDRNILQKKQKKDRIAELQKQKLAPQILEYVSKLPKSTNNFETKETNSEELNSMDIDTDEDEKCEESVESEDFIRVYGSTEFKPLHLKTVMKKPQSVADSIAKFKERAFFGSKNKRESVWELKSNLIKQAAAGKL